MEDLCPAGGDGAAICCDMADTDILGIMIL